MLYRLQTIVHSGLHNPLGVSSINGHYIGFACNNKHLVHFSRVVGFTEIHMSWAMLREDEFKNKRFQEDLCGANPGMPERNKP